MCNRQPQPLRDIVVVLLFLFFMVGHSLQGKACGRTEILFPHKTICPSVVLILHNCKTVTTNNNQPSLSIQFVCLPVCLSPNYDYFL